MFDTICTLPLPSDLIALTVHPTDPLFAVGLASGHVHCFSLPALADDSASKANGHLPTHTPSQESQKHPSNGRSRASDQPRRSSLTRSSASPSPTKGYGTIETLWKTRRHKGSCRALAFSTDGSTLFSAGTDGLIKAAVSRTGRVVGKVATHGPAAPSMLRALSPTTLLLGTDNGAVQVWPLGPQQSDSGSPRSQILTTPKPVKTHFPHQTDDDPTASEPITSITPLPPTAESSSGACRAWISTAGSTLAACDLYKGVVACSQDQGGKGGEELLSSACTTGVPAPGTTTPPPVTIIAGDSSGLATLWARGTWTDRSAAVRIHIPSRIQGPWGDDAGVESLAAHPSEQLLAAGLGNGSVHFFRVFGDKTPKLRGRVLEARVHHDDRGMDGVSAIAFDVHGRLITGGGLTVKVWHRDAVGEGQAVAGAQADDQLQAELDAEVGSEDEEDEGAVQGQAAGRKRRAQAADFFDDEADESDDEEEEESDDDDGATLKRRKRRRRDRTGAKARKQEAPGRSHGILGFKGLD